MSTIELTLDNFEQTINDNDTVFVDFWAEWCGQFDVRSIPTLMAIRDNVVLFSQPGALPAHALDDLIGRIKEIDMDDVRRQIADEQAAHERAAESD